VTTWSDIGLAISGASSTIAAVNDLFERRPPLDGAEPFRPTYVDPHSAQTVRYVNAATGDDANSGMTPAAPWLNLRTGLIWLQTLIGVNVGAALEIAGDFTAQTAGEQLDLGCFDLNALDLTIDFTAVGPNNFFSRAPRILRARPALVLAVTPIVSAPSVGAALFTTTIAEVLVPSAHVGQFLIGSGLGEWAAIKDNGAGDVTLADSSFDPTLWTAPVGIYQTGATIDAGDGADFFSLATALLTLCNWTVQGIKFRMGAAQSAALRVEGSRIAQFLFCDLTGLDLQPSTYSTFTACYVHDGFLSIAGGSFNFAQCVFRNLTPRFHQSGVFSDINECWWDNCEDFGGGGAFPRFNFVAGNCDFGNSTGNGVTIRNGVSRMVDCLVHDNVGNGVEASDGARLTMFNLAGGTNGGFGLLRKGPATRIDREITSIITGALGDDGISQGAERIIATGTAAVPANSTVTVGPFTRWPAERVDVKGFVTDAIATAAWAQSISPFANFDGVILRFIRTVNPDEFSLEMINVNAAVARGVDWTVTGEGV